MYPTRIPSSISVGATLCPSPTTNFAICLTLIRYFASSPSPACMIFVHLATYFPHGIIPRIRYFNIPSISVASHPQIFQSYLQGMFFAHPLFISRNIPEIRLGQPCIQFLDTYSIVIADRQTVSEQASRVASMHSNAESAKLMRSYPSFR